MTITEKYIEIINLLCLLVKRNSSGMEWVGHLACPFCRDATEAGEQVNEKCASLYPVEGTLPISSPAKGTEWWGSGSSVL